MKLIAMDTETDTNATPFRDADGQISKTPPGLDARAAAITSVAGVSNAGEVFVTDNVEDEIPVLESSISLMQNALSDDAILVTWNGIGFDLPYLVVRCGSIDGFTLSLGEFREGVHPVPKYGWPEWAHLVRIEGRWSPVLYLTTPAGMTHRIRHVDIAPQFEKIAASLGVQHSLKPVAKALLGLEPVEVDRSQVATLTEEERRAYVASDSAATLALAEWLGEARLLELDRLAVCG